MVPRQEVVSLPLPPALRSQLVASGFRSVADLDSLGPVDLAKGDCLRPPPSPPPALPPPCSLPPPLTVSRSPASLITLSPVGLITHSHVSLVWRSSISQGR